MRFEMRVLHALGDESTLIDGVGLRIAVIDIADVAMNLGESVALRIANARLRTFVMQDRGARAHRFFGIEHRRQHVIIDNELAAAGFGRRFALRNHSSDTLADEADNPVEECRVVGVGEFDFMSGARIELCRRIFKRQHRAHARHRQRAVLFDR